MRKIEIQGSLRKVSGKGGARQLRRDGRVPAVIYSAGASTALSLDPAEIKKVVHSVAGSLVSIRIAGEESSRIALLRDTQRDPINGHILHADLFEISLTKPIVVRVSVEIVGGIPIGVKDEGGSLQHHLRELEIRCLPSLIPDHIQVDPSSLKVGQSLHVREILLDAGIEMLTDLGQAVVSVAAQITEAKLEALLSTGLKEAKEPEVLTKKETGEGAKVEGKAEVKGKVEPKAKEAKK